MKKNRGVSLVAGIVIAGLISSNAYAFIELNKVKDENKEEAQYLNSQGEQLNVVISQLMNKSSQYASHEDIIESFNRFSASNRIHYNGADYYTDIKDISSHTFDKNAKVKYTVQAEMTFLKDKLENNMSYIQNELPLIVMEEGRKIAEKANSHNHEEGKHKKHDVVIPKDSLTELEKKAKEEFVFYKWNQSLSFNIDEQKMFLTTPDTDKSILKMFVKAVVLEDKGVNAEKADIKIENSSTHQMINVSVNGESFAFVYNKDTKELSENN